MGWGEVVRRVKMLQELMETTGRRQWNQGVAEGVRLVGLANGAGNHVVGVHAQEVLERAGESQLHGEVQRPLVEPRRNGGRTWNRVSFKNFSKDKQQRRVSSGGCGRRVCIPAQGGVGGWKCKR